jgi:RES domain-containing protein
VAAARPPRDSRLLDLAEALPCEPWSGSVWRIAREGRSPTQCSAVGGRWDDRSFDVLYTATHADGACAEIFFHLSRGQPVMPTLARYRLHELQVTLASCVLIASTDVLTELGLKAGSFGSLAYSERHLEYPRTQEIAEAAFFHGRDGMIVPSARSSHPNLVVFCDAAGSAAVETVRDCGIVDWTAWKSSRQT